jgi:regulator of protease activity HflC (stomatin/prohibitin superfamily)
MELQVAAERQKRAEILQSEGKRDAQINRATADKTEVVLASEGAMTDQINRAKGEAEAIVAVAEATANGIVAVAKAIGSQGGSDAVSLRIAEQYIDAFKSLAKESNTIMLPANANDIGGISSIIAQGVGIFDAIKKKNAVK